MKQDFYLNWHFNFTTNIFCDFAIILWGLNQNNEHELFHLFQWVKFWSLMFRKQSLLYFLLFFPGDLKEGGLTGKQSDIWLHEEMQQKEITYTNCKLKKEKQKSFVNTEIALETYASCPKVPIPSWCRKITGWLWTSLVERSRKGGQAPLFLTEG